jgi:hypothetical protein
MELVERRFLKELLNFSRTGKSPMKCRSLDASLFMNSFGDVYPSIMWDSRLANVRDIDYDLAMVWEGKEAERLRRLIHEGRDPVHWTSCEAYQSIIGDLAGLQLTKKLETNNPNPAAN